MTATLASFQDPNLFQSSAGAHPLGALIADAQGDLFGTNSVGGLIPIAGGGDINGSGTVFEITSSGFMTLGITGTVANQQSSAPFIKPFANAAINDFLANQTETVTITGSSRLNGLLIDPNSTTDGGHFTKGAYVFTDTATNATADLQALELLPVKKALQLEVSVTDTAGLTVSDNTTSIVGISVHHA